MKEYLILFDPEKCTRCHGCETACRMWRGLPYGVRYRRVFNIWEGAYPDVKSRGLSIACLHCVDPACMEACPASAIVKNSDDGRVLVDVELCTGCRSCLRACPFGVPQFRKDGTVKIMQKCDLCLDHVAAGVEPPCVETCPGEALVFQELSPTEKKIRESAIAEMLQRCGIVAKTEKHKRAGRVRRK